MAKNDRFQVIHSEGNGLTGPQITVLLDTATGMHIRRIQGLNLPSDPGRT